MTMDDDGLQRTITIHGTIEHGLTSALIVILCFLMIFFTQLFIIIRQLSPQLNVTNVLIYAQQFFFIHNKKIEVCI